MCFLGYRFAEKMRLSGKKFAKKMRSLVVYGMRYMIKYMSYRR